MNDVLNMLVYSLALAICAGAFGFTLGRWLAERALRAQVMKFEVLLAAQTRFLAMERRRHAEVHVILEDGSSAGLN